MKVGEREGGGRDNGAYEALISPVSPARNGAGCKHCSGECWRVITGRLGKEEAF